MALDNSSTPSSRTRGFVLGADRFDRIAAVEGLSLTSELVDAFAEMDRRGFSAEERLRYLEARFGAASTDR